MKRIVALLVSFILIFSSFSIVLATDNIIENKSVQSIKTVLSFNGDPIKGEILEMTVLKDGSFVGAGSTTFDGATRLSYMDIRTEGDLDCTALVFKYNSDGTLAFIKTFGGNGADRFNKIFATSDGGFIASGYSYSSDGGDFSLNNLRRLANDGVAIIVKYDKYGNVKWAKSGEKSKVIHFWHVSENEKGEIFGLVVRSNTDLPSTNYIMRLDSNGTSLLSEDFILLSDFNLTVNNLKFLNDGSFLVCGTRNLAGRVYDGVLGRYDKNGKKIFFKTFSGNGMVSFNSMLVTSENNIVVVGSFTYCTEGKDFVDLNLKLLTDPHSAGGIILKYDMNGNILKGNTLCDYNATYYNVSLRGLIELRNGEVLVQVFPIESQYFTDPITNKKIDASQDVLKTYLYRIDANLNFNYLYKIESPNLIGPYNGISKFDWLPDGTFRIVSAGSSSTNLSEVRVLDIVDKFLLEKTIVVAGNLKKTEFTNQSWDVFIPKYNAAVAVNKSPSTTQKATNAMNDELNTAITKLVNADGTNFVISKNPSAPETSSDNTKNSISNGNESTSQELYSGDRDASNEKSTQINSDSDSISITSLGMQNVDKEKNLFAIWIVLGIFIVLGAGTFFYLIKTKRINLSKFKNTINKR